MTLANTYTDFMFEQQHYIMHLCLKTFKFQIGYMTYIEFKLRFIISIFFLQVLLVIGVTGGAVMSAGLSSSIGTVSGVSIPDALVGGVLMLWGSRFASGCTRYV